MDGPRAFRVQQGRGWLDATPPKGAVIAASTLLTLLIAVGDLATGPYLVFATFYLVPVVLTAWFVGRDAALFIAALAAITGLASTALDPQEVTPPVYLWNGAFRFFTYAFVAVIVAVERTAMSTIHDLASTDPLTGLLNRRRFYEQGAIELARARRDGARVSVVYIDVDELKQRNDTYGHEAGDQMLLAFADAARATFRTTDLVARVGGDEFSFLLPDPDVGSAIAAVERLRQSLLTHEALPVRFSAGVVSAYAPENLDVETLVRAADLLMLEAKAAGRGQTRSTELPASSAAED